jgi:predicted site-specific integrase-resolvase
MTIKKLAKILGISAGAVERAMASGKIKSVPAGRNRIGNDVYIFNEEDIKNFIPVK